MGVEWGDRRLLRWGSEEEHARFIHLLLVAGLVLVTVLLVVTYQEPVHKEVRVEMTDDGGDSQP